jgi:hypothetical protein
VKDYSTWRGRIATPADNARLCQILSQVDMRSDLYVIEDRDPNFFAIHDLHLGQAVTLVIEDKALAAPDNIVAFCSAIVRDGWLEGRVQKVAYVCDLRMVPEYRKQRILPRACRDFFAYLAANQQVKAFYSVSLHANKGAVAARRFSNGQVIGNFYMVNVPFVGRDKKTLHRVSRASSSDVAALADFLDRQARKRQFGYCHDEASLRQRLQIWPGLSIRDFYLIRDAAGAIVACAAPWNAAHGSLRRTRVMAYQGRMRWVKRFYNAEAWLRGFKPLPKPGDCLQQVTLTHLEVKDDDPDLFRDLLSQIFTDYRNQDLHFLNFMMPADSPWQTALHGFRNQAIYFDLNLFLPSADVDCQSLRAARTGFEMAIH